MTRVFGAIISFVYAPYIRVFHTLRWYIEYLHVVLRLGIRTKSLLCSHKELLLLGLYDKCLTSKVKASKASMYTIVYKNKQRRNLYIKYAIIIICQL